mmetsp:Transcript_41345/g.89382  ORF Transcript_41345/g.89382 Transcript_41345/m.89382 type:complete len:567 (+) Transcript_41345:107-1807(+)
MGGETRSLTHDMVFARTKCNRLDLIRNLNLWGNNLNDISILQGMPNLEVLSLSVNNVTSLEPLRGCPRLTELYLRKNDVSDLAEVQHLAALPNLRVLWLNDNPCSDLRHYRPYVLHHLTGLRKLDSQDVTDEERREAAGFSVDEVQTRAFDDYVELPSQSLSRNEQDLDYQDDLGPGPGPGPGPGRHGREALHPDDQDGDFDYGRLAPPPSNAAPTGMPTGAPKARAKSNNAMVPGTNSNAGNYPREAQKLQQRGDSGSPQARSSASELRSEPFSGISPYPSVYQGEEELSAYEDSGAQAAYSSPGRPPLAREPARGSGDQDPRYRQQQQQQQQAQMQQQMQQPQRQQQQREPQRRHQSFTDDRQSEEEFLMMRRQEEEEFQQQQMQRQQQQQQRQQQQQVEQQMLRQAQDNRQQQQQHLDRLREDRDMQERDQDYRRYSDGPGPAPSNLNRYSESGHNSSASSNNNYYNRGSVGGDRPTAMMMRPSREAWAGEQDRSYREHRRLDMEEDYDPRSRREPYSPSRAGPRTSDNTDNILCAVLALIKELDGPGLELVRRAVEQRQHEY